MGRIGDEAERMRAESDRAAAKAARELAAMRALRDERRLARESAEREDAHARDEAFRKRAQGIFRRSRIRELLDETRRDLWHCGAIEETISQPSARIRLVYRYPAVGESVRYGGEDVDYTTYYETVGISAVGLALYGPTLAQSFTSMTFETNGYGWEGEIPGSHGFSLGQLDEIEGDLERRLIDALARDWNGRTSPLKAEKNAWLDVKTHRRGKRKGIWYYR